MAQRLIERARKAYEIEDFAQSVTLLRSAYQIEQTADILYNIAQTCREAGHSLESLALYEKVLAINPTPEVAAESTRHAAALRAKIAAERAMAASEFMEKEEHRKSAELWAGAYAMQPVPIYLFRCGQAQQRAGMLEEALKSYQRFLHEDPKNTFAADARRQIDRCLAAQANDRAQKYLEAKDLDQAYDEWRDAYKLDPQPVFLFRRADAARQAGRRQEAIRSYEEFLKVITGNAMPELRAQAETLLAELHAGTLDTSSTKERLLKGAAAPKVPLYRKWWLWTTVGVVVAAGLATGIAVGVLGRDPDRMGLPGFQPFN